MLGDGSSAMLFDHGAQFFTPRHPLLARLARAWVRRGLAQPWPARLATLRRGQIVTIDTDPSRLAFRGGMHTLSRHLADGLDVRCGRAVTSLHHDADGWRLTFADAAPTDPYHAVIITAPAPQTALLLREVAPDLSRRAGEAVYAPCWALMFAAAAPLAPALDFDAARVDDSPIAWLARDHAKPGRALPAGVHTWVAHASPDWSRTHLERAADEARDTLLAAAAEALGVERIDTLHAAAHRWRYALVERAVDQPCLFDDHRLLAAAGDWCLGPRIEAAYLSGAAAAGRIMGAAGRTSHILESAPESDPRDAAPSLFA
jgi:predicted NAD/FAD-dependent oxidoreductase